MSYFTFMAIPVLESLNTAYVELYKLLQSLNYHVLTLDYRGIDIYCAIYVANKARNQCSSKFVGFADSSRGKNCVSSPRPWHIFVIRPIADVHCVHLRASSGGSVLPRSCVPCPVGRDSSSIPTTQSTGWPAQLKLGNRNRVGYHKLGSPTKYPGRPKKKSIYEYPATEREPQRPGTTIFHWRAGKVTRRSQAPQGPDRRHSKPADTYKNSKTFGKFNLTSCKKRFLSINFDYVSWSCRKTPMKNEIIGTIWRNKF